MNNLLKLPVAFISSLTKGLSTAIRRREWAQVGVIIGLLFAIAAAARYGWLLPGLVK